MSPQSLQVMIIGGGIGGLLLAQGLKKAGIAVTVYERDRDADARLQGYRLNIEPAGSRALYDCLPAALWELLIATSGDPGPRMGVFNEQLHELMQEDEPGAAPDPENAHHAISRITLRRLLLAGLEQVVRFDSEFIRYEQLGCGKVRAFFADGTSATGDLLVGADGARSRVKRQLLPNAAEIDTPAIGVGGKLPLTRETLAWLPPHLTTTKTMILPPRDFFFTAAFRRRRSSAELLPSVAKGLSSFALNAATLAAEAEDYDYLMWAFVGHRRTFPPAADDSTALVRLVEQRMHHWHPTLRRVVQETPADTVQAFGFSAAAAVKSWRTTNVTLLGDALHHMPPVGGMGGNAAMHDANLLRAALTSVRHDETGLLGALHDYETSMIETGFQAVRASVWYTRLAISRLPLMRSAVRGFFKVCAVSAPLRNAVFGDPGFNKELSPRG